MLRASDERSDLIFLERMSRRDEVLGLHRSLLPSELSESKSVNTGFQESMLRTELESGRESEYSVESHSITGKALTLSSKLRLKNLKDNFESMLPCRASFDIVVWWCWSSNAFVAGDVIVGSILMLFYCLVDSMIRKEVDALLVSRWEIVCGFCSLIVSSTCLKWEEPRKNYHTYDDDHGEKKLWKR